MAWYRAGGSGIPASVKTDMNNVLNKKMGTSGQTYPPSEWADDVNLMGMLEVKTASGVIASFSDGADDVPISEGTFYIQPSQSGTGTPSPSNPCPIVGYTGMTIYQAGKNLLAKEIVRYSNSLATLSECFAIHHGTYTVTIGTVANANNWRLSVLLMDGEGNALTDNSYKPSNDLQLATNRWRYGSNTTTKSYTINIVVDCYVRFFIELGDTSSSTIISNSFLEVGSTASTYEPYKAKTPIVDTFGRTVYGGSRSTDGTLTDSTNTITFIGADEESWYLSQSGGVYRFYTTLNDAKVASSGRTAVDCNIGTYSSSNVENAVFLSNAKQLFYIPPQTVTTVADFKTWLSSNNLQVCYEIETPNTYTLDTIAINTYLGANNIFTDVGNSSIDYRSSGTVTPVVPTLITKSITENGTYNASADNADGYSEVTVNVPTAPSGMVVMDFSHITSSFTLNGVSYGSTGAVFDNTSDYIDLPFFHAGMEIEIDVASISLGQNANRRFFSSYRNQGFLYRNNNLWSFYNGSWYDTNIADSTYFNNSTVKIVVDSQNYWHIYKDDVLIFEPAGALAISEPAIGSKDGSCINNATITGVRMKEVTT